MAFYFDDSTSLGSYLADKGKEKGELEFNAMNCLL